MVVCACALVGIVPVASRTPRIVHPVVVAGKVTAVGLQCESDRGYIDRKISVGED